MKSKLIFTALLLLLLKPEVKSQETNKQLNTVFLEGGGIGGYGSINYERIWPLKSKIRLAVRAGLSTYHTKDFTNQFNPDVILPIGASALYGNKHNIEFGIGQTISSNIVADSKTWKPKRQTDLHANFTIGYRYLKQEGGLMFRLSYSPLFEFYERYRHWGGVSVGYAF